MPSAAMARLLDQAVFYFIPVSEAEMLSNPSFVSFWLRQSKYNEKKLKIAILEDAEGLLLPRDGGSRSKVSNLLNLADGLLGDHMNRRLTRPEAQRLADFKGLTLPDQDDFSLAEIYRGTVGNPALNAERQIGFVK
jgi:hypothetical protein